MSLSGKTWLITLFFMGMTGCLFADQIDIGIFESATPGKIEVRIRPDFTIEADETVTGILYTIRWSDPTIVITTLDVIYPFFISYDGSPVLDNGFYYQKFVAVPFIPVGTAIPAGSERVISSFSYTGSTGAYFELIDNYWTQQNNGGPYLEFMGVPSTGIIYHASAPGPCTLSLTCPGNISVPPDAGSCGAVVNYSAPVVSGDCEGVTVTQTAGLPSGSLFPAGTTTNSFLATSSEGPTTNCSFTVTVNSLPGPAGTITGTSPVCQGQNGVVYSVVPITNATSYVWTYTGTGATISGSTSSVTINFSTSATSGNLKVYGVNNCGNGTVSPNFPINVNGLPGAAGPIIGTTPVCQGQTNASYAVAPIANATSYTWTYSGTGATITSTGSSATISFSTTATSGNLTVYGSNNCGVGAVSPNYAITVNPLPGAAGTITGTTPVCQGQSNVTYSVPAISNATSYTWSYSGTGATITGNTSSVTISFGLSATSGNLTVMGVNSCGNGALSPNYAITVNPLPGPASAISGTAMVCQGQNNIAYSVAAIPDATSYGWTYSGTGATINGNGASVTVNFSPLATSGNLTVFGVNLCGNGPTSPAYSITVHTIPSAPVSGGNKTICSGQTIPSLTVTVGAGATADWYASATGGTPLASGILNYTPATAGTYYAEARNLAAGCLSASRTALTLTIHPLPTVYAGADRTIPNGTSTTINDATASGAATLLYSWAPPASFVNPSLLNPTTVNLFSTQIYTLTVTDGNNCSNSDQMTITITGGALDANPDAVPDAVCAGQSAQLYANASGGSGTYTYSWTSSPPGFTSAQADPQVSPSVTTTYTVTVNDGYNSVSESVQVTVHPLPAPPLSGGDETICSGEAIPSLTVIVAAGETADWYATAAGGAPIATGTLIYAPSFQGTFYAEARNLTTGCKSMTRTGVILTIHALPVVFAGSDQAIPYGTSTTIQDATASGTATLSYSWVPAAAFVNASLLNPTTVDLTSSGTYTLNVTDGNGCTNNDQMTITVTGGALAVNPAANPPLICFGESAQLAANASGGSGSYTYSWTSIPVGFTSSQADPQVSPGVTTTYTVMVNDGYSTASGNVTVTVDLLEVACPGDMDVSLDDIPFLLTGGLPQGGTYTGPGVTAGVFDPTAAGIGEHSITYTYEDAYGCTDFCSFVITVTASAGNPGDANCDGVVNVLDIITIMNYIMGQNPSPFCFDEADTNDDLTINVLDIIGTINIIMIP